MSKHGLSGKIQANQGQSRQIWLRSQGALGNWKYGFGLWVAVAFEGLGWSTSRVAALNIT